MNSRNILLFTLALALTACGGEDFNVNNGTEGPALPFPTEEWTGRLIDSPVANIDYRNATGTRTGVTNNQGHFKFLPGETLYFSLGDLELPAVIAEEIITPLEFMNTLNTEDPKILNLIRLLQTLDRDGNPDNGISITDTAKSLATQVDFELSPEEFEASDAVTNLIFNGGQNYVVSGLVSIEEALSHFEQELEANDINFGTVAQLNNREIRQYLEDNDIDAIEHDSGLYYQILNPGEGEYPSEDATITVKYKGYLTDGTVFDETTGDETREFELDSVISGWQISIPLLKPGGNGLFFIPSSLGYGSSGSGESIPPNAVLIFEIELVSFTEPEETESQ